MSVIADFYVKHLFFIAPNAWKQSKNGFVTKINITDNATLVHVRKSIS